MAPSHQWGGTIWAVKPCAYLSYRCSTSRKNASMRREQMGHCDPSSFGTVEQSQKQHRSKLVRLPLWRTVLHRCFLFGLLSPRLMTGLLSPRFVRITRLCFAFCILRCSLRSCSSEAQAAMAEHASAPVPALKSHRGMPQPFPRWLWMMAQGLGGTYYPETNGCSPLFIIFLHFPH